MDIQKLKEIAYEFDDICGLDEKDFGHFEFSAPELFYYMYSKYEAKESEEIFAINEETKTPETLNILDSVCNVKDLIVVDEIFARIYFWQSDEDTIEWALFDPRFDISNENMIAEGVLRTYNNFRVYRIYFENITEDIFLKYSAMALKRLEFLFDRSCPIISEVIETDLKKKSL